MLNQAERQDLRSIARVLRRAAAEIEGSASCQHEEQAEEINKMADVLDSHAARQTPVKVPHDFTVWGSM